MKPSSLRRRTGCRRTIFRKFRSRRSPRGPHPRIWAWRCWPIWPPGILGIFRQAACIRRTRDAFATMQRLERYRGHFYNWYETRTLQPLLPLYVSSVDSGNLPGHLLTLGSGLRELADEETFHARRCLPVCATLCGCSEFWPKRMPRWRGLQAELEKCALWSARGFCLAGKGGGSGGQDRRFLWRTRRKNSRTGA